MRPTATSFRAGGLVSSVHGPEDVARTLEAFRTSVRWLKAEGDIK